VAGWVERVKILWVRVLRSIDLPSDSTSDEYTPNLTCYTLNRRSAGGCPGDQNLHKIWKPYWMVAAAGHAPKQYTTCDETQ